MAIIGNILLVIATLIFFALASILLSKAPKGDGLMGYAWGIIILNIAFLICMILVTLIVAGKGGFEWVAEKKSNRFWFVTIGLLTAIITAALSGLFKYESGPVPSLIRIYSAFVPLLVPVVLIAASVVLLNQNLRTTVPVAAYKWPLILISIIGVTGVVSSLIGAITQSSRNQIARAESTQNRNDANHQRMLNDIDSCDVMKNLVFILVFTGDNQDPEIRERAVAKVKTHPEWQQELIRLLQTDWAAEPFQFLASNNVDNRALFPEPIRIGVLNQARLFRESIRRSSHPSHFYPELFLWETDRVLRTVNKYRGMGVDFRPAIRELRGALNEPSDHEKPEFKCIALIEQWLKDNP